MLRAGHVGEQILIRHHWIKGITYRALDKLSDAEQELMLVADAFRDSKLAIPLALVLLDLACVYAMKGDIPKLKAIAREAYPVFEREGVGREARTALGIFTSAVEAETVNAELALQITNFLVAWQRNPRLQFRRGDAE